MLRDWRRFGSVLGTLPWSFYFSCDFPPVHALYVGQAPSPANSLCSTAEGFPTGFPISLRQPSCLSLGVWPAASPCRSRPRGRLPQPPAGARLSAGRAFLVLDREMDKAAFGPVWLRDARVASVVADALLYGESGRHFYQLRAWVIMPNHVHLVLLPKTSLPVITRWWKGKRPHKSGRATSQPDPGPNGGGLLAG
jgi:hypothetical protein